MHLSTLSSLAPRLRLVPGWRLLLGLLAPPFVAAAVLAGVLFGPRTASPPSNRPPAAAHPNQAGADAEGTTTVPAAGGLLVEVSGAVVHPGMYRVTKGDRVSAAVAAAGGFSPDADPNRLPNMAARLKDGDQVKVPGLLTPSTGSTGRIVRVSLNTASAAQLAAIPGFTPDLVAAVVQYRTDYGGFTTTRELVDVLNMSVADYNLAKRYVRT